NPKPNTNPKPNPNLNLNPKPNSSPKINPKPNLNINPQPEPNLNPKPNPNTKVNLILILKPYPAPNLSHNLIQLDSRKWSPGAEAALRDCFESTEWSVLQEPYGEDIEGITHCMTDYMNFCMDVVVPVKTVRCFANNKPWINQQCQRPSEQEEEGL
ncbi:hypothetical protein NFI96_033414, partial [Prochilodus magdalenae]